MFYICTINLYDEGSYELMEYICKKYKKEIRIVFKDIDGPFCIIIELQYKEEVYNINKIIEYHKKNFKNKMWDNDSLRNLSDNEYYKIINEMVSSSDNKFQTSKVFIFYKSYGQTKDFILNEKFERLIKISLHFKLSYESEIYNWNYNFKKYCENDFDKFINYCFITYPKYDNIDLRKLYLQDKTLNGSLYIEH